MKKLCFALVIVSFLLFVVACSNSKKEDDIDSNATDNDTDEAKSDDDTEDEDEQNDEDSGQEGEETEVTPLDCADLEDGLNENLIVGEGDSKLARSFVLRLPEDIDSGKKYPVVVGF